MEAAQADGDGVLEAVARAAGPAGDPLERSARDVGRVDRHGVRRAGDPHVESRAPRHVIRSLPVREGRDIGGQSEEPMHSHGRSRGDRRPAAPRAQGISQYPDPGKGPHRADPPGEQQLAIHTLCGDVVPALDEHIDRGPAVLGQRRDPGEELPLVRIGLDHLRGARIIESHREPGGRSVGHAEGPVSPGRGPVRRTQGPRPAQPPRDG